MAVNGTHRVFPPFILARPSADRFTSLGCYPVNIDLEVVASYYTDSRRRRFSTKTLGGKFEVSSDVSSVVELDGVGFESLDNRTRSFELVVPRVVSNSQIKQSFGAPTVGHWRYLRYDPSFVALFSEMVEGPLKPNTPKGSNKGMIIGVSVSFALVAVLILSAIIAFTTVPSLKHWIRPHAHRTHTNEPETAPTTGSSPRAPAATPTNPTAQTWASASPSTGLSEL